MFLYRIIVSYPSSPFCFCTSSVTYQPSFLRFSVNVSNSNYNFHHLQHLQQPPMPPVKRRGLSGGEDPGEGSTKRPKEVKDGGRRCVVGGCSNNWSNGYTTYNMRTVKLKNVQRGWVKFVDSTRKDFDHKNALTPHVCDGHFTEDSFVQTQKMQYLSGFRSKVPELEKEAVPTIKIATLPHWTMSRMKSNTSTVCSTSTATCAVSVTTTACSITSSTSTATTCTVTMTSPCITTPTTSTMSSRFASSVERNSVIVGGMISTTKVQDTPKSSRPKQIPRRRSNFLVQKVGNSVTFFCSTDFSLYRPKFYFCSVLLQFYPK